MTNTSCNHCTIIAQYERDGQHPFVITANDYWIMALNENQATLGRIYFSLRRHETDVTAITHEEQTALWQLLAKGKNALEKLFAPDHYNYVFLMNVDAHVHMHIYPRYKSVRTFDGDTFLDPKFGGHYDPQQSHPITMEQQLKLLEAIRSALQ